MCVAGGRSPNLETDMAKFNMMAAALAAAMPVDLGEVLATGGTLTLRYVRQHSGQYAAALYNGTCLLAWQPAATKLDALRWFMFQWDTLAAGMCDGADRRALMHAVAVALRACRTTTIAGRQGGGV